VVVEGEDGKIILLRLRVAQTLAAVVAAVQVQAMVLQAQAAPVSSS